MIHRALTILLALALARTVQVGLQQERDLTIACEKIIDARRERDRAREKTKDLELRLANAQQSNGFLLSRLVELTT